MVSSIVPQSLVAGDTGLAALEFQTQNPLPVDAHIIFEVPATFTNLDVTSTAVVAVAGIDGGFTITQDVAASSTVFDNTLKTSGGPWVVTIARNGDGAIVPEETTVQLTFGDVANQQHEGGSGIFTMLKTTLGDGTTAIDETSTEADAIGEDVPEVVFTPSYWSSSQVPTVTPQSLIAGDVTDYDVVFRVQNPLPVDAVIEVEFPSTFADVSTGGAVVINEGIDGGFAVVTTTANPSVFDNGLKMSGGTWTVQIQRDGTGTVVAEGVQVSVSVTDCTNQMHEGVSGDFVLIKTLLADGSTGASEAAKQRGERSSEASAK